MTDEQRLATLEELCREKDSTLAYLKQDIQALESKVSSCISAFSNLPFTVDVGLHLSCVAARSDTLGYLLFWFAGLVANYPY